MQLRLPADTVQRRSSKLHNGLTCEMEGVAMPARMIALGTTIGIGAGSILGVALGDVPIGIGFGIGIGLAGAVAVNEFKKR